MLFGCVINTVFYRQVLYDGEYGYRLHFIICNNKKKSLLLQFGAKESAAFEKSPVNFQDVPEEASLQTIFDKQNTCGIWL